VIAYVFLSAGVTGTAAALYFVAPAGRGLHRYVVPRSKLRADLARAEAEAEELACKLGALTSELDAVTADRNALRADLGKAERLVSDAEGEATRLGEANKALKAQLSNVTAIRPLVPVKALAAPATPMPSSVAVPLHKAALALSPASEPS